METILGPNLLGGNKIEWDGFQKQSIVRACFSLGCFVLPPPCVPCIASMFGVRIRCTYLHILPFFSSLLHVGARLKFSTTTADDSIFGCRTLIRDTLMKTPMLWARSRGSLVETRRRKRKPPRLPRPRRKPPRRKRKAAGLGNAGKSFFNQRVVSESKSHLFVCSVRNSIHPKTLNFCFEEYLVLLG